MDFENKLKDLHIIACDFDGTLCESAYPDIGKARDDVICYIQSRRCFGDKVILWTCRTGKLLDEAVEWCKEHGLIFDAVNENLPEMIELFGGDTRKIFAHEYFDDKAVMATRDADWDEIGRVLCNMRVLRRVENTYEDLSLIHI